MASVNYAGELRTQSKHLASSASVVTDAPVDNHGKGQAFSPTDLVASALASCMMTIMGIKAEDLGTDMTGVRAEVEKIMSASPRRISAIVITFHLPATWDSKTRKLLEAAALACPVAKSLHPETQQTIHFLYE